MNKLNAALVGVLITVMMTASLPARASMVGTEQMLAQDDTRAASLNTVETFMAREQVTAQLETWGVAPDAIAGRVASLSDAELQRLAATIQTEPAGGDVLIIVGIIFVVLLILELVGVTHIFSAI